MSCPKPDMIVVLCSGTGSLFDLVWSESRSTWVCGLIFVPSQIWPPCRARKMICVLARKMIGVPSTIFDLRSWVKHPLSHAPTTVCCLESRVRGLAEPRARSVAAAQRTSREPRPRPPPVDNMKLLTWSPTEAPARQKLLTAARPTSVYTMIRNI